MVKRVNAVQSRNSSLLHEISLLNLPNSGSLNDEICFLFADCKAVHSYIVLSMQYALNKYQLVMNYTTLHNQISGFASLIEHHYKDPYLVHVNVKFSCDFMPITTNCVIYCVGPNLTFHDKSLVKELWSVIWN